MSILAIPGENGLWMHEIIFDNVYDIVAQDYQLPDMTGLEIARKVLKTTLMTDGR